MGNARITQLNIGAGVAHAVHLHRVVQLYRSGVIEPDAIHPPIDALAGHQACGGLHPLLLSGQAFFIAIAADAPGSVAAHLTHAAVGVEEEHPVVATGLGGIHHHQPVGPDGKVALAKASGQLRQLLLRQMLLQVVDEDKVIAGAVHFPKLHVYSSSCTDPGEKTASSP